MRTRTARVSRLAKSGMHTVSARGRQRSQKFSARRLCLSVCSVRSLCLSVCSALVDTGGNDVQRTPLMASRYLTCNLHASFNGNKDAEYLAQPRDGSSRSSGSSGSPACCPRDSEMTWKISSAHQVSPAGIEETHLPTVSAPYVSVLLLEDYPARNSFSLVSWPRSA